MARTRSLSCITLATMLMIDHPPSVGLTLPDAGDMLAPRQAISVMTYNVEGLPWPVRLGRDERLDLIGRQLNALRRAGRQPHILVLQEAFTDRAKAIAAEAGYRYVATGPTRDMPGAGVMTVRDRYFAADASLSRGEQSGKWLDSGLLIASDYPIVGTRRMAFPGFACAGFDCLANKGALLARIAVPGAPQPVAIIATHLNSRHAAHVAFSRTLYAYQRQVDALGTFLKAELAEQTPFIVTGDFNMGPRPDRRAILLGGARHWRDRGQPALALDQCLDRPQHCETANGRDLATARRRARDLQFYGPSPSMRLEPEAAAAPVGRASDGSSLSDHVGYSVYYRLVRAAA